MITDVSVMSSCKLVTTECLHAGLALRTFTYKEGERFGLKLTRRLELAVKSAGPDEFNPQDPHSQKLSFNLHTHTCMSTRTDIHAHTNWKELGLIHYMINTENDIRQDMAESTTPGLGGGYGMTSVVTFDRKANT